MERMWLLHHMVIVNMSLLMRLYCVSAVPSVPHMPPLIRGKDHSPHPPPSSLVVVSLHFSFSALEARSESHDTLEGWTAVSKFHPWRSPRSDSGPARKGFKLKSYVHSHCSAMHRCGHHTCSKAEVTRTTTGKLFTCLPPSRGGSLI